ncbi:hypothetical protein AAZX31_13G251500 [Glycine max]|uniref:Uncharacterized protein n=2 Tax=Glycine subgen. Soja TaxID=1462606 RepID=I1M2Z8_SOYBN|nr:hypothetical protein JHK85_038153 [Glycine max]KHN36893.1 hypothetical protein glysoja_001624 [Glycine soja]KAG4978123.1 hypothetical protein JHK86_037597 [Glycine max]KAG5114131.1 hypothetical protein JHK82_037400 [Glycine max]KAG5131409.1 hypothetical protein JHK84_037806 [Glycine max]
MTGEEISGPAGPKLLRLVSFVGAAVICTAAINKYREYERNTIIKQQQQQVVETHNSSESVAVPKTLK